MFESEISSFFVFSKSGLVVKFAGIAKPIVRSSLGNVLVVIVYHSILLSNSKIFRLVYFQALDPTFVLALEPKVLKLEG